MKRVLWVFAAVLVGLLLTSCALFDMLKPPITLDGKLDDWGDKLYTDYATDSAWGWENEIHKAGIFFDNQNLYIAGEFTKQKGTDNDFMVIVDFSSLTGATDTSKHPWGKKYTLKNGNIDFVLHAWENDLQAWKVTATGFATVTSKVDSKFATLPEATISEIHYATRTVAEIKIPLKELGITNVSNLSLKAVFVLTGGTSDGGTKQWAGDFYPDQGFGGGGYAVPLEIVETVVYPKK